jgi:hypothetical protein
MQSSPVDMANEEIKVPEYDFEKLIQAALLKGEDSA